MNDKQKINELVKLQGEDSNTIAKFLIENIKLREAAEHFQHCRECAEDGLCWLGKQHDDFLSSLNDRKAV